MEPFSLGEFLSTYGLEVLVLFLVFLKGVLNLIPSDRPTVLFSFLDWLIDYLVPNRTRTTDPKA
jgi:hypothetical protein